MKAYVVQWQTPAMTAPAFWYFASATQAAITASKMNATTKRSVRPVELTADQYRRVTHDAEPKGRPRND